MTAWWRNYSGNLQKICDIIVVLEILKLEWQCSQYHELNPTCVL